MTWGIFKADGVSEAYKKMKSKSCATEELKGDQHKLDVNKNGKIDGDDLAKLRATKKEEVENVEEGWDDMVKYVKDKNGPQPNGGAGKKQGTRYGGSKQKDDDKKDDVKEDYTEKDLDALINEVLSVDQPAGKWIQDFVKSDDPKFAGDSKEQRIKRALGAYYAAKRNESTDYEFFAQYIDLSEEAEVVKSGAKEIKHDNMKEKQATRDEMETHSDSEQAFVDAHSIKDEEEPAKKAGNDQSGKDKVGKAAEPKGQGAAKYDGDNKLSDKDKAKVTAEAVVKTEAGEEIDTKPKEKKKTVKTASSY